LPVGATVGTSSLRRVVLLKALRPDVKIIPLRGNLDTRLRKLDEGQFDAIILAAAGLKRLGLAQRIRAVFEPTEMLPAAGQGALGIEIKSNRTDLAAALAPLAHLPTWMAVSAERAVSRAMGGSCSMPLAAHAVWEGEQLRLNAAWGEPEEEKTSVSSALVTANLSHSVIDIEASTAMGEQVAVKLLAGGARKYTKLIGND
jgi:hydroxymethylbilane synthase